MDDIKLDKIDEALKDFREGKFVIVVDDEDRENHQGSDNTSTLGTPFTITVDKLEGCTTGVSINDRTATIRALADPASRPETFGRPGHINPLYAQDKGVLRRAGHTEAAVDLARLRVWRPLQLSWKS